LPDLHKMVSRLNLSFAMTLNSLSAGKANQRGQSTSPLRFSQDSVHIFTSSVCLRCSFSTTKVRIPFKLRLEARSQALGIERELLDESCESSKAWGEALTSSDHFNFVRSPCGRMVVALWRTDGLVAGLFISIHLKDVLKCMCIGNLEHVMENLVGPPAPDDIDSHLGLHDYTMMLSLRGATNEAFGHCFYKIGACKRNTFGTAAVTQQQIVQQSVCAKMQDVHTKQPKGSSASSASKLRTQGSPESKPLERVGTDCPLQLQILKCFPLINPASRCLFHVKDLCS